MAISFVQWEKYVQSFPDDRLGQEFQNPGSTVAGEEKPPQAVIIAEMGTRNAARKADKAMQASQGEPSGTIGEQTYDEFAGESRPAGGPGGGPSPGAMKASKGQPGGPPMGPGGPPPVGPPMGGPPMMAYGGSVPGYQYGGSVPGYQDGGDTEDPGWMRRLVGMATGADSWEDAAENPFRTAGHTALTAAMMHPGARIAGGIGRLGSGLMGLGSGSGILSAIGRGTVGMAGKGGMGSRLARLLAGNKRISSTGAARRIPGSVKEGREALKQATFGPGGRLRPGSNLQTYSARRAAIRAQRVSDAAIGRAVALRGGGLGVAGLLALDPFDGPEPMSSDGTPPEPPPNTDLSNSSAVRADRSKGFANGAYDWLDEESPTERNLRRLLDDRNREIASGELTEDFQDESLREFIEDLNRRERSPGYVAPRQGYADLPEMASGGFAGMGYKDGGDIPLSDDDTLNWLERRGKRRELERALEAKGETASAAMPEVSLQDLALIAPTLNEGLRQGRPSLGSKLVEMNWAGMQDPTSPNRQILESRDTTAINRQLLALKDEITGGDEIDLSILDQAIPEHQALAPLVDTSMIDRDISIPDYLDEPEWKRTGRAADRRVEDVLENLNWSNDPEWKRTGRAADRRVEDILGKIGQAPSVPDMQAFGTGFLPITTPDLQQNSSSRMPDGPGVTETSSSTSDFFSEELSGAGGDWSITDQQILQDPQTGQYQVEITFRMPDGSEVTETGSSTSLRLARSMARSKGFAAAARYKRDHRDQPDAYAYGGMVGPAGDTTAINRRLLALKDEIGGGEEIDEDADGAMKRRPRTIEELEALSMKRIFDLATAKEEELRLQNPAERAQEEYWDTRLRREQDNRFNILAADVAETIGSRTGTGDIARGLAGAARNQVEQGRLITDLEGLPFAEDVRRSRESTYRDQLAALGAAADTLGSRGELEATLQQRRDEVADTIAAQLAKDYRITSDDYAMTMQVIDRALMEGPTPQRTKELEEWKALYEDKWLNQGF